MPIRLSLVVYALDASMNQKLVDATHIKLSHSALAEDAPTLPFMKMSGIIGNLTIAIEEVK